MIRPSDKGPGRNRQGGTRQPKVKYSAPPPAKGGGGGKKGGCFIVAVPAVALIALSLLTAGAMR